MRSAEDIAALYRQRLERLGSDFARMRDVAETYDGDLVLPLPELSQNEQAAVANLTKQGVDQFARRISSVMPVMEFPPMRPSIRGSVEKAGKRKQIGYGFWEKSKIKKVQARRARWLLGYGAAPVIVRPDPETQCPRWDPHSPLDVFPSRVHLDSFTPHDVIIRHKRNFAWLDANYPEAMLSLRKHKMAAAHDMDFEVLEYIDPSEVVFVVLGNAKNDESTSFSNETTGSPECELVRKDNRAGMCWAVIPSRVTLNKPGGHFDDILGMYKTEAALMALEIIATRKAIYPTPWLVNPNNGAQPHVIQHPDAQTGEPGVVTNGTLIFQEMDPSMRASTVRQDLQYAQRQTAGLPAELGGMSQQNVRTARRGSQIMGAATDFTLAEAQDAFAEAGKDEMIRAMAIDTGYFDTKKQFYVSTKGVRGVVEYKPSDVFEPGAQLTVEYPAAGMDASDLVINGTNRIAQGTLSKLAFMRHDPMVDDAEAMTNEIRFEAVEAAFLSAFQEQMAQPDAPWRLEQVTDFARRLANGEKWYEAAFEINEELKEKQAEGAEPGSPEAMPGMNPEMAPGGIPALGEPEPSLQHMAQLLGQLGTVDQAARSRN